MSDNSRRIYGLTQSTVNAVVAKGTTSTYSTTNSTAGVVNGKWVTPITAQTNTATPVLDASTGVAFVAMAINKATVLVIGQTFAGAIQMSQGSVEDTFAGSGSTAGAFNKSPQFPFLPDDFLPLAYLLVRTAPSASAWTAGTSSWTATGITASAVQNVACLPDRPQAS